ncbi:hypothetical protein CICLE_v10024382mg [Citrus x clementina]|uniref:Uncharacterized protein n=1 Tax=Citrus clementina TaxID=85681 RepID=V4VNN9_CITCL|nr:hypothetical protein CICLE_v10024382mg [Citrus x clementina]
MEDKIDNGFTSPQTCTGVLAIQLNYIVLFFDNNLGNGDGGKIIAKLTFEKHVEPFVKVSVPSLLGYSSI